LRHGPRMRSSSASGPDTPVEAEADAARHAMARAANFTGIEAQSLPSGKKRARNWARCASESL
jgi:hypothetical protein